VDSKSRLADLLQNSTRIYHHYHWLITTRCILTVNHHFQQLSSYLIVSFERKADLTLLIFRETKCRLYLNHRLSDFCVLCRRCTTMTALLVSADHFYWKCSGLIKPDTKLGGKIKPSNEVNHDNRSPEFYSRI
jgi:hypothetical protein